MPENHPVPPGPDAPTRRVRLTPHSTTVSNAVLLGYANLSDGARLTYMVLESYDWPDKDGFSKGRCWPSIETIATARGKSYDSVARHLKELEAAGLIRVESGQERGVANCYWLLGPSEQEFAAYLERFTESSESNQTSQESSEETINEPYFREIPGNYYEETSKRNCYESAPVEETGPVAADLPQPRGTYSRKHAGPAPAKILEKKHEFKEFNFKNFEIKKDSNPIHSRSNRGGSTFQNNARSLYITQILQDFSKSLNDLSHVQSNQSQAQNLFRQSGLDERAFVELLYEAKKRTQWAVIATPKTVGNGPNRAAYFFKVVRNLLDEKSRSSPHPDYG